MPQLKNSHQLERRARTIVERLNGTWRQGKGMCCCPAHDDRTPSLSVTLGRKAILFHCFAGCSNEDVIAALDRQGVRSRELFDGSGAFTADRHNHGDFSPNARRLWQSASAISDSPVERYLSQRGLQRASDQFRYLERTPLGPRGAVQFIPAMLAAVTTDMGIIAVHRTFLDVARGKLAGFERPKRALGTLGCGAVRLAPAVQGRLGLAEGIESALSAMQLFGIPCWATLGNERFGLVSIPESVRELYLFIDNDAGGALAEERALKAYAAPNRVSPAERATGIFAAVGAIHRDTNRPDPPNCVAHYWEGYDHELAHIEGRPATLIGYLRRGVRDAAGTGDVRPITEKAADAVLRLATMLNPSVRHPKLANRFRQLGRLLEHDAATLRRFHLLCLKVAAGELPTNARVWQSWKKPITDIATALLAGAAAGSADEFMAWDDELGAVGALATPGNIFSYPSVEPAVRIKVGSIHSVKGETHLATLVFDTHYKGSHLTRIKDWLTGARSGLTANKPELRKSLKQHYVAVTRPSHLVCLAMRSDAFTDAELVLLRARNWNIGDIANHQIVWRP